MNRRMLAMSTLATAVGLVVAAQSGVASAQQNDPRAKTMEMMQKNKLVKCYGVAAKGKNDCAEGAHSCAGQATQDHDKASFVLLPAGACDKIVGGSLKSS
ncbi:DUF2282 domain-containing protein [Azospirillum griseum]|uniref:DUF2282 domain-containing protein n=2 Tax=Azospirillum griseum TaxID=2496639 RepID=A0A3S0KUF7_9PROT|nr:DUF2282 domain-containing protein [Azospirillum griseum]